MRESHCIIQNIGTFIGTHFARLEAELRHKEAQSLSDQSSGSVGGSDQASGYYLTEMCGLCIV